MIKQNVKTKKLTFNPQINQAIHNTNIIIITVETPMNKTGNDEFKFLDIPRIAELMNQNIVIDTKNI